MPTKTNKMMRNSYLMVSIMERAYTEGEREREIEGTSVNPRPWHFIYGKNCLVASFFFAGNFVHVRALYVSSFSVPAEGKIVLANHQLLDTMTFLKSVPIQIKWNNTENEHTNKGIQCSCKAKVKEKQDVTSNIENWRRIAHWFAAKRIDSNISVFDSTHAAYCVCVVIRLWSYKMKQFFQPMIKCYPHFFEKKCASKAT